MKAEILTPKQAAIRDMRAAGLDTTVLRRTVIVEETEEFVFRSIDVSLTVSLQKARSASWSVQAKE